MTVFSGHNRETSLFPISIVTTKVGVITLLNVATALELTLFGEIVSLTLYSNFSRLV